MSSERKKRQHAIDKIIRKCVAKRRNCCSPNCHNDSINSHLLQKSKFLKTLSPVGHVYEYNSLPFYGTPAHFSRRGINEAFTFKGFCREHDDTIFSHIEKDLFDPFDYKSQLLLSYRAIANERRKKQIIVDWYNQFKKDDTIKNSFAPGVLDLLIDNNEAGRKDLEFYERECLKNLDSVDVKLFTFLVLSVDNVEVFASSTFNLETGDELYKIRMNELSGLIQKPINNMTVHLIPIAEKQYFIIGYHNSYPQSINYTSKIARGSEKEILKSISDILIQRIETWGCSERTFEKFIRNREKEIIAIASDFPQIKDATDSLNLNIFE